MARGRAPYKDNKPIQETTQPDRKLHGGSRYTQVAQNEYDTKPIQETTLPDWNPPWICHYPQVTQNKYDSIPIQETTPFDTKPTGDYCCPQATQNEYRCLWWNWQFEGITGLQECKEVHSVENRDSHVTSRENKKESVSGSKSQILGYLVVIFLLTMTPKLNTVTVKVERAYLPITRPPFQIHWAGKQYHRCRLHLCYSIHARNQIPTVDNTSSLDIIGCIHLREKPEDVDINAHAKSSANESEAKKQPVIPCSREGPEERGKAASIISEGQKNAVDVEIESIPDVSTKPTYPEERMNETTIQSALEVVWNLFTQRTNSTRWHDEANSSGVTGDHQLAMDIIFINILTVPIIALSMRHQATVSVIAGILAMICVCLFFHWTSRPEKHSRKHPSDAVEDKLTVGSLAFFLVILFSFLFLFKHVKEQELAFARRNEVGDIERTNSGKVEKYGGAIASVLSEICHRAADSGYEETCHGEAYTENAEKCRTNARVKALTSHEPDGIRYAEKCHETDDMEISVNYHGVTYVNTVEINAEKEIKGFNRTIAMAVVSNHTTPEARQISECYRRTEFSETFDKISDTRLREEKSQSCLPAHVCGTATETIPTVQEIKPTNHANEEYGTIETKITDDIHEWKENRQYRLAETIGEFNTNDGETKSKGADNMYVYWLSLDSGPDLKGMSASTDIRTSNSDLQTEQPGTCPPHDSIGMSDNMDVNGLSLDSGPDLKGMSASTDIRTSNSDVQTEQPGTCPPHDSIGMSDNMTIVYQNITDGVSDINTVSTGISSVGIPKENATDTDSDDDLEDENIWKTPFVSPFNESDDLDTGSIYSESDAEGVDEPLVESKTCCNSESIDSYCISSSSSITTSDEILEHECQEQHSAETKVIRSENVSFCFESELDEKDSCKKLYSSTNYCNNTSAQGTDSIPIESYCVTKALGMRVRSTCARVITLKIKKTEVSTCEERLVQIASYVNSYFSRHNQNRHIYSVQRLRIATRISQDLSTLWDLPLHRQIRDEGQTFSRSPNGEITEHEYRDSEATGSEPIGSDSCHGSDVQISKHEVRNSEATGSDSKGSDSGIGSDDNDRREDQTFQSFPNAQISKHEDQKSEATGSEPIESDHGCGSDDCESREDQTFRRFPNAQISKHEDENSEATGSEPIGSGTGRGTDDCDRRENQTFRCPPNIQISKHEHWNSGATGSKPIGSGPGRESDDCDRREDQTFRRSRNIQISTHEYRNSEATGSEPIGSYSSRGSDEITEIISDAFDIISTRSVTESMRYEWGRFRTFWSFPMECPMLPTLLAKYGFYYTGNRDEVICFSCHVSHSNWKKGDSVYAVHYQISRRCCFMNGDDVGNVPIHGPLSCLSRRAGGRDGGLVATAQEMEMGTMLSSPETVSSVLRRQEPIIQVVPQKEQALPQVQKGPTENNDRSQLNLMVTGNGAERGGGEGGSKFSMSEFRTAAPSVSQSAALCPENAIKTTRPSQNPPASQSACLQTHAVTRAQTSMVRQNATHSAVTSAATNGKQSLTDQTGNQQLPMNQQHPTTLAQRQQQRRLEHPTQPEQHQQQGRQPTSATANGAATNPNNPAATARARYPNYSAMAVRSGTFNGFPNHLDQTPVQMAIAGFFYAGYGDYVRCFFCGGGLRNWEPGDDPWVEHARWFPRCAYVKQNRGQTFINLVLQRQRELTLPNEYINTARGASNTETNEISAQTARIQTNNNQQSSTSNSQAMVNTQTGTNSPVNTSLSPAGQMAQAVSQRAAAADDMKSPAVLSVKNMGYSDQIVKDAIQRLRNDNGPVELTAMALLEIIFQFENIPPESRTQNGSQNTTRSAAAHSTEFKKESNTAENNTEGAQSGAASHELITKAKLRGERPAHSYTEEELKSIQEENDQLKEQMKCKVCMDNSVCISFLPCGHLCCCAECAPAMVKCPICRQIIRGSVKTYLS